MNFKLPAKTNKDIIELIRGNWQELSMFFLENKAIISRWSIKVKNELMSFFQKHVAAWIARKKKSCSRQVGSRFFADLLI